MAKFSFKNKGLRYVRTILIVLVAFTIIGNYLYENNSYYLLNPYYVDGSDPDYPIERFVHTYPAIELEGGHKYTIFVHFEGQAYLTLDLSVTFSTENNSETLDDFSFNITTGAENTWLGIWSSNSQYTDPFTVENDEIVRVKGFVTSSIANPAPAKWYIRIYQDLPVILTNKTLLIGVFDAIVLLIWAITYEQYEAIFHEIEEKKRREAQERANNLNEVEREEDQNNG